MQDKNPLLEVPDPYKEQKEKFAETQKDVIEFQRLWYEILHVSENGKKAWEMIKNGYLIPSRTDITAANPGEQAIYWEGWKSGLLNLFQNGMMHAKRINEGVNSNV